MEVVGQEGNFEITGPNLSPPHKRKRGPGEGKILLKREEGLGLESKFVDSRELTALLCFAGLCRRL